MRIVIDTQTFLGLVVPLLSVNFSFLKRDNITLTINEKILNEYIGRAKYYNYRITDIDILLRRLYSNGFLIKKGMSSCEHIEVPNKELQDDAHIIKLAKASNAEFIVTQDYDDLLYHKEKIQREFNLNTCKPEKFDIFFIN